MKNKILTILTLGIFVLVRSYHIYKKVKIALDKNHDGKVSKQELQEAISDILSEKKEIIIISTKK